MGRQRWEYLTDDVGSYDMDERLNVHGALGWELVAVIHGNVFIFKRPLQEDEHVFLTESNKTEAVRNH